MQDADFSDEFCLFIQTAIPALDAAELLLALSAQPDAWWDTAQAIVNKNRQKVPGRSP